MRFVQENPIKSLFLGLLGLFLLVSAVKSYKPVPSGSVGVQVMFGEALPDVLNPGPNFVIPWINKVVIISTQPVSYEMTTSTSSKDIQQIKTTVSVQHYIDPALAAKGYAEIGNIEKYDTTVISPAVYECLKAITAEYTAEQLITKRDEAKTKTDDAIQKFVNETLAEKGVLGSLHIINVSIKDLDFSDRFNDSIEAKVQAEQDALKAVNEKTKRITEAEADNAEKKLATDAEKYQLEQTSIARAEAITREAKAIADNPHILKLRAIEQWSGEVPKVSGSGQIVPFLNLDQLDEIKK